MLDNTHDINRMSTEESEKKKYLKNTISDLLSAGEKVKAEDFIINHLKKDLFDIELLKELMHIYDEHNYCGTKNVFDEIKRTIEQKVNYNTFIDSKRWKQLFEICFSNGHIRLAGIMREKALESSYSKLECQDSSPDDIFNAFKAAIDLQDYKKAFLMIGKIKGLKISQQLMKDVLYYYFLNKGEKENLNKLSMAKITRKDLEFFNYINGKTVAIVGPAPHSEDLSKEIDSYDIVIRFTYRGARFLPQNGFGIKTNISYYNVEYANTISEYNEMFFLEDLDYAVFKSVEHDFQRDLIEKNRGREIFFSNHLCFKGFWNMAQIALYDIFHFNPKEVKLFHTNFFLSENAYDKKYCPKKGYSMQEKLSGWAAHDVLTQINFVKNLWESKMISVDSDCERVLKLSLDEYLSQFENIYIKQ